VSCKTNKGNNAYIKASGYEEMFVLVELNNCFFTNTFIERMNRRTVPAFSFAWSDGQMRYFSFLAMDKFDFYIDDTLEVPKIKFIFNKDGYRYRKIDLEYLPNEKGINKQVMIEDQLVLSVFVSISSNDWNRLICKQGGIESDTTSSESTLIVAFLDKQSCCGLM